MRSEMSLAVNIYDGEPMLSICIPTFNRMVELSDGLERLKQSMLLAGDGDLGIEVIVSNNASTDGTDTYLKNLTAEHPWIRVFNRSRNMGAADNFYYAVERSRGRYVWILGDDDRLKDDAVRIVLKALSAGPAALILNYLCLNGDFTEVRIPSWYGDLPSRATCSPNEVLEKYAFGIGFCTSLVVRREVFMHVGRSEYLKWTWSGFSHLRSVYLGLLSLDNRNVIYLSPPLVLNRGDNSPIHEQWADYFIKGVSRVLDSLVVDGGYRRMAARRAKTICLLKYHLGFMRARHRARFRKVCLSQYVSYYGDCWFFWFLILPLYLMPGCVLDGVVRLKAKFGKLRSFGGS